MVDTRWEPRPGDLQHRKLLRQIYAKVADLFLMCEGQEIHSWQVNMAYVCCAFVVSLHDGLHLWVVGYSLHL